MLWATTLLHDPDTLQTYEEYARESAYEADGAQPPPSNSPNHRHQSRETPTERSQRTGQPDHDSGRIPLGVISMFVNRHNQEETTPPGSPFDEGYTTTTFRGAPTTDPPASIQMENFFTPYTQRLKIEVILIALPPIPPSSQTNQCAPTQK